MEEAVTNSLAEKITEEAAKTFFERVFEVYQSFIDIFPIEYQWIVSAVVFLAVAGYMWNLIRKNWLWLTLLIVVFPTTLLPALQNIFNSLSEIFIGKPMS